ncbi:hypothetical protein F4861DRAFT_268340 [Xylaria intraflava]|nr:hypothetical protein F4861DRAFT_268340 [Xylaria intraflava]
MFAPGRGVLTRRALVPPPYSRYLRDTARKAQKEPGRTELTKELVEKLLQVHTPQTPFSTRGSNNGDSISTRQGQSSVLSHDSLQSTLTDSSPSLKARNSNSNIDLTGQQKIALSDDWPHSKFSMPSPSPVQPPVTPVHNDKNDDISPIEQQQDFIPSNAWPYRKLPMPTPLPPLPPFLTTEDINSLLEIFSASQNGNHQQTELETTSKPPSQPTEGNFPESCTQCPIHCPCPSRSSRPSSPTPTGSAMSEHAGTVSDTTIDPGAQPTASHGLAMSRTARYARAERTVHRWNPFSRPPPRQPGGQRRPARTATPHESLQRRLEAATKIAHPSPIPQYMVINDTGVSVAQLEWSALECAHRGGLRAAGLPQHRPVVRFTCSSITGLEHLRLPDV